MKGCCGNVLQVTMIIVNILWAILSLLTGIMGLAMLQASEDQEKKGGSPLLPDARTTATFAILIGSVGLLLAVLGCLGAWREKARMVNTYAVLLTLIAVCELGVGIAAVVHRKDVEPLLKTVMEDYMEQYGKGGFSAERAASFWDSMQKEGSCCGINGHMDWAIRHPMLQVPESCCQRYTLNCERYYPLPANINTEGCLQTYTHDFTILLGAIGVILIVSGGLKLVGALCACVMSGEILKERAKEVDRSLMLKMEESVE